MKQRAKKALTLLLAIVLILMGLPLSASAAGVTSGKCGDNVTWSYDTSSKTLTISGKGPMEDFLPIPVSGTRMPPWNDDYTDNLLGKEIKAVRIDEGVTSIGGYAFMDCEVLTSVSIPNSVTTIAPDAFIRCNSLPEIHIPKNVISLYYDWDLYPSTPFPYCNNLKKITVDSANTAFTSLDGVLYNKGKTVLIAYPGGKGDNYSIPNGTKEIGVYAFGGCSNLTSITIPNTVTRIRAYAFTGSGITSLTIPSSITQLKEPGIFSYCPNLRSIKLPKTIGSLGETNIESDLYWEGSTVALPDEFARESSDYALQEISVEEGNKVYASVDGVLYNKSKTRLIYFPGAKITDFAIPSGVTSISPEAFIGSTHLRSVTIPKSVTRIGAYAFGSLSEDFTIYGIKGSFAETYAKNNHIKFAVVGSTDKPSKPTVAGFKDVFEGQYYAEAVKWAVENDITSGTSKNSFSPNAPCTRAQAVTFLWRAAGKPEPVGTGETFTDIKANAYYEKAVQWAVEQGITSGTGNGKFSPDSTCTRAQIVTFLYRAENSPAVTGGNSFSDVPATAYYKNAVEWAAENEITSGTGGNKFSPENNCVRGQIVTFLYRYAVE